MCYNVHGDDKMKHNLEVESLDIDGVLTKYVVHMNEEELEQHLDYMQEVFDEFKLTFPPREELKEAWKHHNVYIHFKLSMDFSKEMIDQISSINMNGWSFSTLEKELNKENKKLKNYEWHHQFKEVDGIYCYQIVLQNKREKTYKIYDLKHDSKKKLPRWFQTEVFRPESVEALNKLHQAVHPKIILVRSSWNIYMNYTRDMLRYQGVDLENIEIERLGRTDTDLGLSIAAEILKRNIGQSYVVVDDDITPTYTCFGKNLIAVGKQGLRLEDVENYLENHNIKLEKEKVKVKKHGN